MATATGKKKVPSSKKVASKTTSKTISAADKATLVGRVLKASYTGQEGLNSEKIVKVVKTSTGYNVSYVGWDTRYKNRASKGWAPVAHATTFHISATKLQKLLNGELVKCHDGIDSQFQIKLSKLEERAAHK